MNLPDGENIFGVTLLRDIFLEELLDGDSSDILYFAGKDLAKKFASNTLLGIENFFKVAKWGDLKMISQQQDRQTWILSGEVLVARFATVDNIPNFYLEAGFLAQQIAQQIKKNVEATYQLNKDNSVTFTLIEGSD
jgi:predicted hydrocarbon binding protein